MTNAYAATAQIASAKRRGWFPSSGSLTSADVLALYNEEQRTYMAALLKSTREEYLVNEANYDVTYPTTGLVRVPPRCIASALRSVAILDSQSNPVFLTRIEPENASGYPGTGTPAGYMLRGNLLQLLPAPSGTGTLRLGFLQRPSTIVDESACGVISLINTGTKAVTISASPSTFSSSTPFDLVQGVPPFSALSIDQAATKASQVYTFANTLPTGLAVGDFICLAGETPIPQLPLECHALLAQRVVVKLLEAQGGPRYDAAKASMDEMRRDLVELLSPRVTGSNRVIVNPYGPGMRRSR